MNNTLNNINNNRINYIEARELLNMINDLISFLGTLNFVDIVFFTAVITLLILVVVLLYILKTSDDDKDTSKLDLKLDNTNEIKDLDLVSLTKELESILEEVK